MNKDHKTRDTIIYGKPITTKYDIKNYKNLTLDQLRQLVALNFIELDECQNSSPSVSEFLEFIQKFPQVTAHGYVVSPERNDYRVSIEGLEYKGPITVQLAIDFTNLCREADEFTLTENKLSSWYD